MRSAFGIVVLTGFAVGGCASGHGDGAAPRPPGPVDIDRNTLAGFDYLGPLWEPTKDGLLTLPNLATCSGGLSEYPFASCIEAVTLDGAPADAADLRAGQIVEIHGERFYWRSYANAAPPTRDSPTVTIDIQRAIIGPVEAIDVDHAWLTVLGQRVYAYDSAVTSAAIGDIVTVYGHFTADGQNVAELIEPYTGDPLFLLRGVLTEPTPGHLAIGDLEVDISSAARENFPGGTPLPGDTVLVLGDQPPTGGVLSATTVRCVGACLSAHWEFGSVHGFLTAWRSATDFDIDGIAVRPEWCDCAYAPSLAPGSFIDVKLAYGNAEVALASSTSLTIGLAGKITAKDSVQEEVVVHGYRVHVTPATHITTANPDVDFDVLPFDNLDVGDAVEISGEALGTGIRADAVVRQGDANIVKALGYALDEPVIEVAGRTILTDGTTRVELCQGDGLLSVETLFTESWWSDPRTWLLIVVDPNSEPLVARRVIICPPTYTEPDFHPYP